MGSKQFSCHLKDCTLNPECFISREKVFGFHHICRGVRGLRVLSHLLEESNSPSPWSPTSHYLCPASITCNLSSYNTLPRGRLALGVICSLCRCQRTLPKMQAYLHHCPAYRTTAVHMDHQDKHLNGGCPTRSSMSCPFAHDPTSQNYFAAFPPQ